MTTIPPPATYTAREVIHLTRIPRSTLYEKAQRDKDFQRQFGVIRAGKTLRFSKPRIDKMIGA